MLKHSHNFNVCIQSKTSNKETKLNNNSVTLTLDFIRRESEWKPSNSLDTKKTTSLIFPFAKHSLRRPCCCDRLVTAVINTATSFHPRVSKSWKSKSDIFTKKTDPHETKMADFNLQRCSANSFQALHLSGKMYDFQVPPCQKNFREDDLTLLDNTNT